MHHNDKFAIDLLKANPLFERRLGSSNVGLVLFTGCIGSGKQKAAQIALDIYTESGGKFIDVQNASPQQIMSVRRSEEYLFYFGDLCDGDAWCQAMHFLGSGYGVIACMHRINDERLLADIEKAGLHTGSVIMQIKGQIALSKMYKSLHPEEAVERIDQLVDGLIASIPFLEVRMQSVPKALQPAL
jgi:hypothetical protein